MPCLKSRRFTFTYNNHDQAVVDSLRTGLSQETVRYAIFGREVGASGTPHLQGYVSFTSQKSFTFFKKLVGDKAHVEVAKGDEASNFTYCSKDGDYEEFGSRSSSGRRSDLEDFKTAVKDGCYCKKRLTEDFTEVCAKYPRFVAEYIRLQVPVPDIPMHPLTEWQQDLNQRLIHEPDDRKVIFVVDYKGNKGKSWFAKYYMTLHDNAYLGRPGKHADMAFQLPDHMRVFFLDCTRQKLEYMPYTFLEELKDGMVFSSKYESCIRRYPNLHVVVLMNQDPDMSALSADRYDIITLK